MKKAIDANSCIRLDRDESQIMRCKEKIEHVNAPLSQIAQVFALSGNLVRLKILFLLKEEQKLCVCDLSEILEMKIPAVSQHLRKMKDARLLVTERAGTIIFYQIPLEMKPILGAMLQLIQEPQTT